MAAILVIHHWAMVGFKRSPFSASSAEFYGASKFSSYKLALFRKLCGRLHNVHNLCSKVWKKKAKKPFFYRRVVPLLLLDHFTISSNAGNFL